MTCISCSQDHNEKFCPNCGEKASTKKITFSSVLTDFFSTITTMDKGFLYNLKALTLNPKELITNYIGGKRKGIYNPISFLIISVTIFLIIDSLLLSSTKHEAVDTPLYTIAYETGRFLRAYFKYFWILSIFWLSLSTRLIFKTYNFAEHLAINSFIIGYATLVAIFGNLVFRWVLVFDPFIYLIVSTLLYRIFKKEKAEAETVALSFLSILLFFLLLSLTLVGIGFFKYILK